MKTSKSQHPSFRKTPNLKSQAALSQPLWNSGLGASVGVEVWILKFLCMAMLGISCTNICSAEAAPAVSPLLSSPTLPDTAPSIIRVLGALALVIGLFLGGVWAFRNWQRLAVRRGNAPRLNVLEVRSLGGRQAIYVVGYEEQRFLLASTPTGINLLT